MKKKQMKETDIAIEKPEEDDQIEKDKENLQTKLETENESLQIIGGTEMYVNRETLEKDNRFTKKGNGETDMKKRGCGWRRTGAEVQDTKEIKSS